MSLFPYELFHHEKLTQTLSPLPRSVSVCLAEPDDQV